MNDQPPLIRQALALKREIPTGCILCVKVGDFYKIFGEDATIAAPICGISLINRGGVAMCGFPTYAVNTYLTKFVRCGKSVALADEMECIRRGSLIRREVTRVITPRTTGEEVSV